MRVFLQTTLLLSLSAAPLLSAQADEQGGVTTQRRIPYAPPPPIAPCPPAPPNMILEVPCKTPTLGQLRSKYLKTEGVNNRGLNFFHYARRLIGEHSFYQTDTVDQANYSINLDTLFEKLGPPDFQKSLKKSKQTMVVYAYLFDYKSNKDYVMSVYTANGLLYRKGYSETRLKIDDSWERYLGKL